MAIKDNSQYERKQLNELISLHKREQIVFETNYYEEAKILNEFRKNTQTV